MTSREGILTITDADAVTLLVAGATSYPGLDAIAGLLREDISGKRYDPDAATMPDPDAQC